MSSGYRQFIKEAKIVFSKQSFEADPDVLVVVRFMQDNIPAARLISVSRAVNELAPLLWGQHEREPVQSLSLSATPVTSVESTRAAAI